MQLHVQQSIAKAERLESKLTQDAMTVPSFTSPKIRHLLNNLGAGQDLHYLEVGVHKGGTFVAANFRNHMLSSMAVDNWSEFAQDGESRREFLASTARNLFPGSYQFLEMDCFGMTKENLPKPVNFYLYDGNHSYEAQKQALTHFYSLLADQFIFVVDDHDWPDVKRGTKDGIDEMNLKRVFEQELLGANGWWNGLYVSVLAKS